MSKQEIISTLIIVFGISIVLAPLWWWALFGMSSNVQTAWIITVAIVAPLVIIFGIWGDFE